MLHIVPEWERRNTRMLMHMIRVPWGLPRGWRCGSAKAATCIGSAATRFHGGSNMPKFVGNVKGYLIHGAAVAVVFLNPSVLDVAKHHAALSGAILLAWGWLLHWAEGKLRR